MKHVKPPHLLKQDVSQPLPMVTFLGISHSRWCRPNDGAYTTGKERNNFAFVIRPTKHSPPISASCVTTWRWFRHHTLPTHHIPERQWCRGDLQALFHGVVTAVGWCCRGILQVYVRLGRVLRGVALSSQGKQLGT